MQDRSPKLLGAALVATLTLCLAALSGSAWNSATAQDLRGGYEPSKPSGNSMSHRSLIRIPNTEHSYHRNVRIGLGKSVLVEFPRDVRDVMVSNPQAVDAVVLSSNRVFLLARRIGEANAFFFDGNGEQFATLELFVERETAGLEEMLNRLIPGGNIKVEMINQTVILTGHVRSPADASRAANIAKQFVTVEFETKTAASTEGTAVKKFNKQEGESVVINLLQVEGEEQVMLRVVVAEVQRSLIKQFGVNLGAAINSGNFTTSILSENNLPLSAAEGLGGIPLAGIAKGLAGNPLQVFNSFAGAGGGPATFGNSGIAGSWTTPNQSAAYVLRALERDGLIKTLAEPNLTAVSGETARFLAGGEFPIPVVDTNGQISVVFKEFGVGVAFTPVVLSEGRISLKIESEVSELSNQGAVQIAALQIPAIKTRRASSTVELPSGGSLAMAGLLSEHTRQNIDGFPGLKDVPILGTLFRSRDFIRRETELVVIVTPYVVRPTARKDLARPSDGLGDATDMKGNFLGHVNRIYGRGTAIPDGGLKGDYGFIVE